jgi:hypothetical protein
MPKMVLCKILGHEIPLARCKPVKGFGACESCEGSALKLSARRKHKSKEFERKAKHKQMFKELEKRVKGL